MFVVLFFLFLTATSTLALPIRVIMDLIMTKFDTFFRRLGDHFLGKQHIGFQYMRDTLEAIRKRRLEAPSSRVSQQTNPSGRERDNSRDRHRRPRRNSRSRDTRDAQYGRRDGGRDRDRRDHRDRDRGDSRDRR